MGSARPVFFEHNCDWGLVARCLSVRVSAGAVFGVAQFPPRGANELSDFVFDRVFAGEITGASISFKPNTVDPRRGAIQLDAE